MITDKKVMLVDARRALDVETYDSPYDAVYQLLDCGSIGDGVHGSEAHLHALTMLKAKVERVIASIKSRPIDKAVPCAEDDEDDDAAR